MTEASLKYNPQKFFGYIRPNLFWNTLNQSQVDGINSILTEWDNNWSDNDLRYLAYILATSFHETAQTMQPIEEYGKGRNYPYGRHIKMNGQPYFDYLSIYYGRGHVQLTWYENYQKAGNELGQDFLGHPERVMLPDNAAKILFRGMFEGWFTGRKLGDYFTPKTTDWVNARRIINGLDKALLIADHAKKFYAGLLIP